MNRENKFIYDGQLKPLFFIFLFNAVLSVVTLGIYSFWGKTRMRKYIIGSFSLLDDRFEYTGNGKELFIGFLKAMPLVIGGYVGISSIIGFIAPGMSETAQTILGIPLFLFYIYLFYVGFFAGLRYKLSRITWRGIRGRLTGSALKYGVERIMNLVANIFTLGLMSPYFAVLNHQFLVNKMYFGSQKLSYQHNKITFYPVHFITLLLAIPTLGISRMWYVAAKNSYLYSNTYIGNLQLSLDAGGKDYFSLYAVNMLILLATLGFGVPIVIQRNLQFMVKHTAIIGDIETSGIMQSDEVLSKSGEGLESFLNNDGGFM